LSMSALPLDNPLSGRDGRRRCRKRTRRWSSATGGRRGCPTFATAIIGGGPTKQPTGYEAQRDEKDTSKDTAGAEDLEHALDFGRNE
jgi:hypothetical protein